MVKAAILVFKYTATTMSAHVTELERLVLDMTEVGCPPSEDDVCATLLRSLPSHFESLAQALRTGVTQFSFSDLVSKLISEEVRHRGSNCATC